MPSNTFNLSVDEQ
jgi:hypothetical protein